VHVRVEEDDPAKKLAFKKPFRSGKMGWPKLQWVDDIEVTLKTLGVRRWREKGLGRMEECAGGG
jgi:hypothetical protein